MIESILVRKESNTQEQGTPSLTGEVLTSFESFRNLDPSLQLAVGQRVILFEVEMLRMCEGRWNSSNWQEVWDKLLNIYGEHEDSVTAEIYSAFKNETGLSPGAYLKRPVEKIFQLRQCGLGTVSELNNYRTKARHIGNNEVEATRGAISKQTAKRISIKRLFKSKKFSSKT